MLVVAGREPVVGAKPLAIGPELDRDVEMLGPEVDLRGVVGGTGGGDELAEHRVAERVPVAEDQRRGSVDAQRVVGELGGIRQQVLDQGRRGAKAGQRRPALLATGEPDQLCAVDSDLLKLLVVAEGRSPETARRRLERDLVVGLSGAGRQFARPPRGGPGA